MGPDFKTEKFNPFPGLRPFLPEESDLFFGRETESEEVLGKLLKNRFITVIGASGSGKSSLIYCGVLPKIKKLSAEKTSDWSILTLRPGNDPVGNLTEAFEKEIQESGKSLDGSEMVSSLLKSGPDGISKVARDLFAGKAGKILILVDQFEELFRYSTTTAGIIPGEEAGAFVKLLETAVEKPENEVYIIITMRSDFIGECAHFQGFTQLINSSNYLVPHMSRDNYRAAIEGPVKYGGAAIDADLVTTLLDDIGDQTDQLPVLQHALMRTWAHWQELDEPGRAIDFSDYDSVGTMSDAMSRHANEAFEELSPRGREICEKTFKTITEKGADNKGVRHPSSIKTIKSIVQCTGDELFEVVEKFRIAERSFITPRENIPLTDDSVIDLSHESLMRLWDRLKGWVDEEAAAVNMYLRLSEASAMYQQGKTTLWRPPDLQLALNWRDQHKPTLKWAERYDPAFERAMVYLRTSEREYLAEEEKKIMLQKRQIKRTKIVAMILAGASLISLAFMLFAFIQKIQAENQKKVAQEQTIRAEIQKEKADSSRIVADTAKIHAEKSANEARLSAIQADIERRNANTQKGIAQFNEKLARENENIARQQTDSATRAKELALENEKLARIQKARADTLRMLSIGKAMSIKSLQVKGRKDLQTLLAYQAYLFNNKYRGEPNDADIFAGLYNVSKQYGNVNYKVFTGHKNEIKSIAFVPGKREFYTAGSDGKVLRWNLDKNDQSIQVYYSDKEIIEVLAVSPDASWLACGSDKSVIKMIPLKGNTLGFDLKGHTGNIRSLIFSFDGKYLYSASLDGKVLRWDLAARSSRNLLTDLLQINLIDISSNGKYLAGVSKDGKVIVWDPEQSSDNFRPPTGGKIVKTVRFKPDENKLAIGYTDGRVELWDLSTKTKVAEIDAHTGEVNSIQFNTKYNQMATASTDASLKLWDTHDFTKLPINFDDNETLVMVVEFSPDGQLVISGTYGDKGPVNLVARPTYVNLMASDICSIVSRNLDTDEWSTYVAKDIPYEKTCKDKEYNIKVNVIR
jgi:WD40 repeat protein